jgi:putative Holliday junction resolvase
VAPQSDSVLGVDYGRARIGLAIAEGPAGLPRPLDTLDRINRNEDMRRLREIVRTYRARKIVVGLPLRLDGTHGEMAHEAARFGERLRKQLGVAVEMQDERLTSWEAERLLETDLGRSLAKRPDRAGKTKENRVSVDSVAAAVILRDFLERERQTAPDA